MSKKKRTKEDFAKFIVAANSYVSKTGRPLAANSKDPEEQRLYQESYSWKRYPPIANAYRERLKNI